MSKLALTGLAALVILLLGAGVVLAQGSTSAYGGGMRGMMNTITSAGSQTTPRTGTYGPGMMGNVNGTGTYGPGMMSNANGSGTYGPGMMSNANGSGIMSEENWNRMRDAMNSGNWDEMKNVCQDTMNSNT